MINGAQVSSAAAMSAAPLPRPARRLQAARVFGATLLSVLGVRIIADVHADSFLGAPDQLFSLVNLFSLGIVALTLLVAFGLLVARRWSTVAMPLVLSLNVGVFVPLLAYDVQIGGFLILWNLALIGDSLFSLTSRNPRSRRGAEVGDSAWLQRYGAAAQHPSSRARWS